MGVSFSPVIHTWLQGLFFVLLFFFAMQALFLGYHWFKYGSSRRISLIALSIYLGGGAILFLTFSIALQII